MSGPRCCEQPRNQPGQLWAGGGSGDKEDGESTFFPAVGDTGLLSDWVLCRWDLGCPGWGPDALLSSNGRRVDGWGDRPSSPVPGGARIITGVWLVLLPRKRGAFGAASRAWKRHVWCGDGCKRAAWECPVAWCRPCGHLASPHPGPRTQAHTLRQSLSLPKPSKHFIFLKQYISNISKFKLKPTTF